MRSLAKLLTSLQQAKGAAKKKLLTADAASAMTDIMHYTYGKDYVYGVKPEALDTFDGCTCLSPEDHNLLIDLAQRRLSGGAAAKAVASGIERNPLLAFIIRKDLRIGLGTKGINAAWCAIGLPAPIPTFDVQLAKVVPLAKIKLPVCAETKYDGVRLIVVVNTLGVKMFTRNGKQVFLPAISDLFETQIAPCVVDGELVMAEGSTSDRTTVSGIVTKALHGNADTEGAGLVFKVFDHLPLAAWQLGSCSLEYLTRRRAAAKVVEQINHNAVQLSTVTTCYTVADINRVYAAHIDRGMEGLILKQPKHLYSFKRTGDWAKMKETVSADLNCLGCTEGTGKYAGMIGALVCSGFVDNDTYVSVAVSGLTEELRAKPPSYFRGRTVEVLYNTVTCDKVTGRSSLFLPRFKCFRDDK